jgi:hypothetical protein
MSCRQRQTWESNRNRKYHADRDRPGKEIGTEQVMQTETDMGKKSEQEMSCRQRQIWEINRNRTCYADRDRPGKEIGTGNERQGYRNAMLRN